MPGAGNHQPDLSTVRNMPDSIKSNPEPFDMADCNCGDSDHCWIRPWPDGRWTFHRLKHRP